MTDAERHATLETIAAEVRTCTRCRLHQGWTQAVPGEGNPATEVVFVGEAPGFNEDRQGRPFVGRAGALLERVLDSIYWSRDEVFITNMVKCRPPDNRDPEPDELAACAPYLTRQLAALDPALVVTLGRFSMARFSPGARIGQVHGTFRTADAASGAPDAFTLALYHPAAALRQQSLEQALFADMGGVPNALQEARAARADRTPPPEAPVVDLEAEPVAPDPVFAESAAEAVLAPAASSTPSTPVVELELPSEPDTPAEAPPGTEIDAETDPTSQLLLF